MMRITEDNIPIAVESVRDILYMYYDMARCYGGFGATVETGSFDSLALVDCCADGAIEADIDVELIQHGSAVAIVLRLHDELCRRDSSALGQSDFSNKVRLLLDDGRLDHLPLARRAVVAAFESEDEFWPMLPTVYDEYVTRHMRRLFP